MLGVDAEPSMKDDDDEDGDEDDDEDDDENVASALFGLIVAITG